MITTNQTVLPLSIGPRQGWSQLYRVVSNALSGSGERHLDRGHRFHLTLEEFRRVKAHRASYHNTGYRGDSGVVVEDPTIVKVASVSDLVLGVGELPLQVEEVLVRLEIGVGLGHREQRAQRAGERVICLGCGRGRRRALELRPRSGDGVKSLSLVAGVAAPRLDQIRDQFPPPLKLDLNCAPA